MQSSSVMDIGSFSLFQGFFDCFLKNDKAVMDDFLKKNETTVEKLPLFDDLKQIFQDYYGNNKTAYGKSAAMFSVVSDNEIPEGFSEMIETYISGITEWLCANFSCSQDDFPFVFVHVDPNYSSIPRAYMYPDKLSVRIGLCSFNVFPEKILHELVHGLSFVLDRFASELLAHYGEFSGLGLMDTVYRQKENEGITVKDVLVYNKDDLPDIYNMFFGNSRGSAQVVGPHNYIAFYFIYLFQFLEARSSFQVLLDYIKNSDSCRTDDEKEKYFQDCFAISLRDLDMQVRESLLPDNDRFKTEDELEELCKADPDYHIIKNIYLKTAVKKNTRLEDINFKLRIVKIDYKLYQIGMNQGFIDQHLLKKINRTVNTILDEDKNIYDAWVLRYYVLTEYIVLHYSKKESQNEPDFGRRTTDSIKSVLSMLEILDKENIETKMIFALFYLYYPKRIGGNVKKGLAFLDEVFAMDQTRQDVYYQYIRYYLSTKKKKQADEWLDKYKKQFGMDFDTRYMDF